MKVDVRVHIDEDELVLCLKQLMPLDGTTLLCRTVVSLDSCWFSAAV